MKKLLVALVASVVGVALWRTVGPGKPAKSKWAEAVDKIK